MAIHAIAGWCTVPRLRMLSSIDDINCVVAAFHRLSEGEIDHVSFSVAVNGGAPTVTNVSTRTLTQPSHFPGSDSKINWTGGGRAPVWGYSHVLSAASYNDGDYIDVTPTAVPVTGTSYTLPTQRYWCHKSGGHWHCTRVIYADSVNGNDSNDGLTSGTAVATMWQAHNRLLNYDGIYGGSTDTNVSGGIIYLAAGSYEFIEAAPPTWWVEIATDVGTYYTITAAPGVAIEDVVISTGTTYFQYDSPYFAILFQRITFNGYSGAPGTGTNTGAIANIAFDDCRLTNNIARWGTCGIRIKDGLTWADFVGANNVGIGTLTCQITCCEINAYGSIGGSVVFDNNAANAVNNVTNWFSGSDVCWVNNQIKTQRTGHGYLLGNLPDVACNGVVSITANGGGAGIARVQALNGSVYDFEADCAHLAGGSVYYLHFSNWADGGNNGNFAVVAAGRDGSNLPYVDISNASAVSATGTGSSSFTVFNMVDNSTVDIHGDGYHFMGPIDNGLFMSNRYFDWSTPQTHFFSNVGTISNIAIVNEIVLFGDLTLPVSYAPMVCPCEHLLIRDCTFNGSVAFDSTLTPYDGEINNVVYNAVAIWSGTQSQLESKLTIDNCMAGLGNTAYGTNCVVSSTTLFLNSDYGYTGLASLSPSGGGIGTANSAAWPRPSEWFVGNRGAWENTTTGSWDLGNSIGTLSIALSLLAITIVTSSPPPVVPETQTIRRMIIRFV